MPARLGRFYFEGHAYAVHRPCPVGLNRREWVEWSMRGFCDALAKGLKAERGPGQVVRVGLRTFAWESEGKCSRAVTFGEPKPGGDANASG